MQKVMLLSLHDEFEGLLNLRALRCPFFIVLAAVSGFKVWTGSCGMARSPALPDAWFQS